MVLTPPAGEPLRPADPRRIGPYTVVSRLGAGGMGQVYLGRDRAGQLAAVKVVHQSLADDPAFRSRFAREIATAEAVRAPWTARVLGAGPKDRTPWLATEYVAGPDLDAQVTVAGPLPPTAAAVLARRLAAAVAGLHASGVVHRDLKPSNVLLAADGPRLIDFGIARATDATKITRTGGVVGTPAFMSPEQVHGAEVGPASDVFSLASVLTFAATGAGPFGQESPVVMLIRVADQEPDLRRVPEPLRGLIAPCLAKDPGARPSAAELVERLAPFDPGADPAAVAPAPLRRRRRWPIVAGLALALAAALILLVARPWEPPGNGPAGTPAPSTAPQAVRTIPIEDGDSYEDLEISADGSRLFLTYADTLAVLDRAGAIQAKFELPSAQQVALAPDGRTAWVSVLGGFVVPVDVTTGRADQRADQPRAGPCRVLPGPHAALRRRRP